MNPAPAVSDRPPFLRSFDIALPAITDPATLGEAVQNVGGTLLYCLESDYSFDLAINDGAFINNWMLGLKYYAEQGTEFRRIRIRNRVDKVNNIRLLIGQGRIDDHRVNIVEARNGSAASAVANVWQNAVPSAGDTVAVSNALVKIAEANPNRAQLLIRESAGNGFFLCYNGTATQRPLSYAGSAQFSLAFKGEVWAIRSGGADATLTVTEQVFG